MEVRYTLTLGDYVAFSCHRFWCKPLMRRMYVLGWVLPTVAALTIAALFHDDLTPLGASVLGLYGVVYGLIYPRTSTKNLARVVRRRAGANPELRAILGPITLILTEEALTERTRTAESVVRWRDMKEVEEVGDATYIAVTERLWAILPRAGFECDEDYEAVREFALRKLTKSAGPGAAPDPAT